MPLGFEPRARARLVVGQLADSIILCTQVVPCPTMALYSSGPLRGINTAHFLSFQIK